MDHERFLLQLREWESLDTDEFAHAINEGASAERLHDIELASHRRLERIVRGYLRKEEGK